MICDSGANLREYEPDLHFDDLQGGLTNRIQDLLAFLEQRRKVGLMLRELVAIRPDIYPALDGIPTAKGSSASHLPPIDQITLTQNGCRFVIICDEFEKFFRDEFVASAARPPFIREVVQVAMRDDLPIKWVFSLRTEYLGDFGLRLANSQRVCSSMCIVWSH